MNTIVPCVQHSFLYGLTELLLGNWSQCHDEYVGGMTTPRPNVTAYFISFTLWDSRN